MVWVNGVSNPGRNPNFRVAAPYRKTRYLQQRSRATSTGALGGPLRHGSTP